MSGKRCWLGALTGREQSVAVIDINRACNSDEWLLEHLVCPQQQRLRDGEAEGFGGLEVDYQLDLIR